MMQLLIAGDLVPTKSNESLFNSGQIETLIGNKLVEIWQSADMRLVNLEVPLTDQETPIIKNGPNLKASTSTIHGIKNLNPTLVTLANNHILDHGVQGLDSTQNLLNQHKIPFIGAGRNIGEASKPYIVEKDGVSIGIYACADHEFSIATQQNHGANPFDPLESLDQIKSLKAKCDYLIVLFHSGKEHYRYPSPYLQKVCRKMVEKGADIVVCQHSHCVGCYENYHDATIIYGQGNFIFDYFDSEFWRTGLLVKVEITDKLTVDYIPIVKKDNLVRLALGENSDHILNEFFRRSKEICLEGFVEGEYLKFANQKLEDYLRTFSGLGKWASRIDRRIFKGNLLKRLYKKDQLLKVQNYIECESHRELLIKGLKDK
ncbi:CapA family protein [Bacillus sp. UNC41MFS5]|uniref:CapA family protein n=1 Tax=Bacillus sp. UNC41MFS5 TaxID=1449046 RepID=UPI001E3DFA03|nr:CapA family protein [Bacillus sp. UNC41MFS5]